MRRLIFIATCLSAASCFVDLLDPTGRLCDATHPCSRGQACVAGHCLLADGGSGDGGAGVGGGDGGGGSSVDAGIYFIDPTLGSDLNSGATPQTAWRTLGKASLSPLSPGAQILVKGGETISVTSTNLIAPTFSGAPGSPIIWGRYGGDGGRPILDGDAGVPFVALINQNWHTITGFEMRNLSATGAVFVSNAGNITLDDVFIHDVQEGIHPSVNSGSVNFTLRNSTILRVRMLPDGGGQSRGVTTLPTSLNWRIENTEIGNADLSCATDVGANSVFEKVWFHDCGEANVLNDASALALRGANALVISSRFERAVRECILLAVSDGGSLVGNVLAHCDSALNVASQAAGTITVRRNVVLGGKRLVRQDNLAPLLRELLFVNNTFLGGELDGGPTQLGVVMRPGGRGVFENNIIGGFILKQGTDQFLDVAPGWDAGFFERGNGYQTDGGKQFAWAGANAIYSGFVSASGTIGGSFEGDPVFLNSDPANPNVHLSADSGLRGRAVINPGGGILTPGCDGGYDVYCGAGAEPGAFELGP